MLLNMSLVSISCALARSNGRAVDVYGHVLRATALPGGSGSTSGWHLVHNGNLEVLTAVARVAGAVARKEPRGLLTSLLDTPLQARAAASVRSGNAQERELWQQLIPDLHVTRGGKEKLYDLKCINFCQTRYGRMQRAAPAQADAANHRAGAVATSYLARAQNLDRREAGARPTQVGPVETALNNYGGVTGLCLGHYGEASDTVEEYLRWCAAIAAAACWKRHGYATEKHATGAFLSCFRHRVGLEHARLKARHLHLNLQHVEGAEGNAQAQTAEQAEQRAGMARGMRARKPHHFRLPHTRGWSGRFRPM